MEEMARQKALIIFFSRETIADKIQHDNSNLTKPPDQYNDHIILVPIFHKI